MTFDEFRSEMESYRQAADEEGAAQKDSYLALERLSGLYRKFEAEERDMADRVLIEWAASEDENKRFDALALIDEFRIVAATPTLLELSTRLATSNVASAPYELAKVRRILKALSGAGG
jgi:hypothetical protein